MSFRTRHAFHFVFDAVKEGLGQPMALRRLVSDTRELRVSIAPPAGSISASNVVPWESWAGRRSSGATLWRPGKDGRFSGTPVRLDDLVQLGRSTSVEKWECDICEIAGFAASKASLTEYASITEFALAECAGLIETQTPAALAQNLGWPEIRIINQERSSDYFQTSTWDGRVFLMNCGGSHHFAAAQYLSCKLGEPVRLRGRLKIFYLDKESAVRLRSGFEMFVVSSDPVLETSLRDALERFGASYILLPLPRPYTEQQILMLPRAERKSEVVGEVFRVARFQDFGEYLERMATSQRAVAVYSNGPKAD